jgi:hypothetical protein
MPPPPSFMRPAPGIPFRPGIGIGISIGGPSFPPPLYPSSFYPPPRPTMIIVDPICDHYHVMYRECANDPWRSYRVYESRRLALDTADQLRDMGYDARVLRD